MVGFLPPEIDEEVEKQAHVCLCMYIYKQKRSIWSQTGQGDTSPRKSKRLHRTTLSLEP
jgi:hypothetical protein